MTTAPMKMPISFVSLYPQKIEERPPRQWPAERFLEGEWELEKRGGKQTRSKELIFLKQRPRIRIIPRPGIFILVGSQIELQPHLCRFLELGLIHLLLLRLFRDRDGRRGAGIYDGVWELKP
jgi:hypothetical protein